MRRSVQTCVLNKQQPRQAMRDLLTRLGLDANLKLCLDAGDAASYTSGASWLDRSGNGYDFFLGADGSATATDPAFNGTAGGKSKNEFWSFDGGDFFTYDSANEAWMDNLHKASAKFSFATWLYYGANPGVAATIVATGGVQTNVGLRLTMSTTGTLTLTVGNGSGTVMARTGGGMPFAAWCFVAATVDATVGANGCALIRNATVTLGDSTYTTPAATAAVQTMRVGASSGAAASPFAADMKLANFMAWEGVALSVPQLQALYGATYRTFQ